jgi:hypothetical protein
VFNGLGGARRVSQHFWEIPVGIFGRHDIVEVAEIAGDMPCLISRGQLKTWGAELRLKDNLLDLRQLQTGGQLCETPGGHLMLDMVACDEATKHTDLRFRRYLLPELPELDAEEAALHAAEAKDDESPEVLFPVSEAIAAGTWNAAVPQRVRKSAAKTLAKLDVAFRVLADDLGQTMVWELFAGVARLSKTAAMGGHVVGAPYELKDGFDLRDLEVQEGFLWNLHQYRPWLVTAGWPCKLWGKLAKFNHSLGGHPRLFELREADRRDFLELVYGVARSQQEGGRLFLGENPAYSEAYEEDPLKRLIGDGFELVEGDQCQWGLRGE